MIRECEYCRIDFEAENRRRRYCSTAQCKRDRQAENVARYAQKVNRKADNYPFGPDPTEIRPNCWQYSRRSRRGDESFD